MRRSLTFKRWDVISVPFPLVEGHAAKRRPALVVSTDAFHRAHHACFGAMITTARHMQDLRPHDIAIEDLGAAGLARPCVVRVARRGTFEWGDQIRRVGTLQRRERPGGRSAAPALVRGLTPGSMSAIGTRRRAVASGLSGTWEPHRDGCLAGVAFGLDRGSRYSR
jgi:mRNA interferase MazF